MRRSAIASFLVTGSLAVAGHGEDRGQNRIRDAGVVDFVRLPGARPLQEQALLSGSKADVRYGQLLSR
jgi:hypothetical protein